MKNGLSFMVEKSIGKGEDADPILLFKPQEIITGVFDGMGGSGAAVCKSHYGEQHTKAYVASRIIKDATNELFRNTNVQDITYKTLHDACYARLKEETSNFPAEASILRSKLIRNYPTTLAVACISEYNSGQDKILVNSFWAGDSRNFLWTKEGFFQISADDLSDDKDPLENLTSDCPLSNCVCEDRDFQINQFCIQLRKQPCVIISATDGCFGYFRSPMHFEFILRDTLQKSKNIEHWEDNIKKKIQRVSGDDFSMSLAFYGTDDFGKLKKTFKDLPYVNKIKNIISLECQISKLEEQLEAAKCKLSENITDTWKRYKTIYCSLIDDIKKPYKQIDYSRDSITSKKQQ